MPVGERSLTELAFFGKKARVFLTLGLGRGHDCATEAPAGPWSQEMQARNQPRYRKRGMLVSENYDKLVRLVEEVKEDLDKAEAGNKSAAVRVRKQMQEVKAVAQELRKDMMAVKKPE